MVFEVNYAQRVEKLPVYLFVKLEQMRAKALAAGRDVINLGVGDPDVPTPDFIVKVMQEAVTKSKHHGYPSNEGTLEFRQAVVGWMKRRFDVELDPVTEVLSLLGSKEGLGHIPFAFINPGDVVLVPTPGYPVYNNCTILAGGEVHIMPLKKENKFLPDLNAIRADVARRAKLMFLNYPNNPTAAVADKEFFTKVVEFAKRNNIIVCHDAAYTEMAFDGYQPPSFLASEGAKDVGIELHSLSKTFRMTGWRIGYAVGNAKILKGLFKIKSNIDSGIFSAIQEAAVSALSDDHGEIAHLVEIFQERRDIFVSGLRDLGWEVDMPKATFYVWAKPPVDLPDSEVVEKILQEADIVCAPGSGYGEMGKGYVRFALTVDSSRLKEAVERLGKVSL